MSKINFKAFPMYFKEKVYDAEGNVKRNKDGEIVVVEGKGRHDPCVVPRAVPIVESLAAMVLADMLLIQRTRNI